MLNDIRISSDNGFISLLVLLDLSAAFDIIDHLILLDQGCQTQFPGGRSVCRFLWFPFNQLSSKACIPRCVYSLANQLLDWTKGAENNPKTSRHSGPPGLEFDTCGLSGQALSWFRSYLSERHQFVYTANESSYCSRVRYGIQQPCLNPWSSPYICYRLATSSEIMALTSTAMQMTLSCT